MFGQAQCYYTQSPRWAEGGTSQLSHWLEAISELWGLRQVYGTILVFQLLSHLGWQIFACPHWRCDVLSVARIKTREGPRGSMLGHLQGINRTEQRRSSSCSRQENPLLIPQEQQSIFFFPQTTSLFSTCFSEYCVFMIQFLKCQGCTTRHPYVISPHPYCPLCTALLRSEPIITAVKPCWR